MPSATPASVATAAAAATTGTSTTSSRPLSAAQVRAFKDDGFIIVDGLLDVATHIAPIQRALARKVDKIAAALLQAGVIGDTHSELPLDVRMEALARDA